MKRTISAMLAVIILLGIFAGQTFMTFSVSAAENRENSQSEVLFFTSFEDDEESNVLLSEPDGDFSSNLALVEESVQSGDGLAVKISSVGGSPDFNGEECKTRLFDGNTRTKFLTESNTSEVYFRLEKSAIISSFKIASANDEPSRDPRDIVLYGSNDKNEWKVIYRASDISFNDRYQEKTFEIANNTAEYLWYKLNVTKNNGSGNMTQYSELALYGESVGTEEDDNFKVGASPMSTLVTGGPSNTWGSYSSVGWTGYGSLAVSAKKTAKSAYARNVIFDSLDIRVGENTRLSYVIFPGLKGSDYDYYYTSMHFVVDLEFDDGTYLSGLGAKDHNGMEYTPEGQAHGEALYTLQWNYVQVDLSSVAKDKTIKRILIYFSMEDGVSGAQFETYFDDIKLENTSDPVYSHLSDYIDIRRGSNNTSTFSRGLTTPAAVVPNGFNFYTPVTNPSDKQVPYSYQLAGGRNTFDSMSVMHVPSNWIGSWGTWQFMVNTSIDTSEGTSAVTGSAIASSERKAEFKHENEIAKAHYYSVTFDKNSAASGVRLEITPTSHGVYARFTFPEECENVNLIFDSLWGGAAVKINDDGTFSATSDHTSGGSSRMHVYGVIDGQIASYKTFGDGSAIISFPKGTTSVGMKLATSYIGDSQAKHSLELEIGDKSFDEVLKEAQKAWDDICSVVEIEGATYTELVTFYSSMYHLYAYPTLYSENEGTNENEKWVYASPYNGGRKTEGKMYVNNGFWDTYRTAWAAYGLLTPTLDGELLDGLVQHYKDQGWVPRWVAPGGQNSMVGTSSDVIFADAYIKGLSFDFESAYNSMLKNASVVSKNLTNGGRTETESSVFRGYVSNSTENGFSWTMEGFINDYGLYVMSEKLGKTDEAEYYYNRCLRYAQMYNSEAGFFMGKNKEGQWSSDASSYNPAGWWGDYTEASGWIMAFTSVFDGNGLANIFGGKKALEDKLDAFFDDSVDAMKKVTSGGIHEEREAREVRMGQYAHNNQPSHHIIYMYNFTENPAKAQMLVRTVLKKLYVGSEIGQGYCGDEDNGEMSAWYIFSSMGFYPLSMGSGEYAVGSPLFDKVTVHLENGNTITVTANNNSDENVYIKSCTVNSKSYNSLYFSHEDLVKGANIVFEMSSEPTNWGSAAYSEQYGVDFGELSSLTKGTALPSPITDVVTKSSKIVNKLPEKLIKVGNLTSSGIKNLANLFDDTSETASSFESGSSIVFASSLPHRVSILTLTSAQSGQGPTGVRILASNDGENWKMLEERSNLKFEWKQYTMPVAISEENRGMYLYYKVELEGSDKNISLAEVELLGIMGGHDDITPIELNTIGIDKEKGNAISTVVISVIVGAAALAALITVAALLIIKKKRVK